jgi:fatty-acyl-CoA synthase
MSDRIIVAGRNVDAGELDRRLGALPGVRPGCCVAVPESASGFAVVFEPRSPSLSTDELRRLSRAVFNAAVETCGSSPTRVVVVAQGGIPKTPSGKVKRRTLGGWLARDSLGVLAASAAAGTGQAS